jgi:DNA polymerase-3 subunit delta'
VSWQRIRGHDRIIAAFTRAMQRGRLAHAYLFVGPAGVGKRLFAGELAKALLCESRGRDVLEACDECPSCRQLEAGTHPDCFTAMRPPDKPNFPIDVIRELCRGFSMKSARGRGKVGILDDADDLDDPITGNAAANCFLKTLEEPPPHSVFILVGSSIDRQLPTIQSRCQTVRFRPLASEQVDEILRGHEIEDARRPQLVQLSDGSPGQALALSDEELWKFRKTLLQALAAPQFDSVRLAAAWHEFVEQAGKESALQRGRAALALRMFIELLDDAMRLSLGRQARVTAASELRILENLAAHVRIEQLAAMLERCLDGDTHIDRRVQLMLLLEALTDALEQKLRQ